MSSGCRYGRKISTRLASKKSIDALSSIVYQFRVYIRNARDGVPSKRDVNNTIKILSNLINLTMVDASENGSSFKGPFCRKSNFSPFDSFGSNSVSTS
ncbi:unnamed protein product [Linum trigynum]|uniref:Uncharacterized protein n=1 Tax=Linum trigynum TaxID=586398 RepID=A0AAV2DHZ3_9ROSI